jgi:hypothetical protein
MNEACVAVDSTSSPREQVAMHLHRDEQIMLVYVEVHTVRRAEIGVTEENVALRLGQPT